MTLFLLTLILNSPQSFAVSAWGRSPGCGTSLETVAWRFNDPASNRLGHFVRQESSPSVTEFLTTVSEILRPFEDGPIAPAKLKSVQKYREVDTSDEVTHIAAVTVRRIPPDKLRMRLIFELADDGPPYGVAIARVRVEFGDPSRKGGRLEKKVKRAISDRAHAIKGFLDVRFDENVVSPVYPTEHGLEFFIYPGLEQDTFGLALATILEI